VKIAKNLLKKNVDLQLALLIYRNTPLESGCSPNELMFNRKVRDILPMFPKQLNVRTNIHKEFVEKREITRKQMAHNYNKRHRTVSLCELNSGDSVWIIDLRKYGIVVRKAKEPRSYFVNVNGVLYRRNRWHLVPAPFHCNQENYNNNNIQLDFNKNYNQTQEKHSVSNSFENENITGWSEVNREGSSTEGVVENLVSSPESDCNNARPDRLRQKPKWLDDYVTD